MHERDEHQNWFRPKQCIVSAYTWLFCSMNFFGGVKNGTNDLVHPSIYFYFD